jgi:hypothetical protein
VPRLVLLEDDGREVFSGDISRANYEAMLRLFAPHAQTIKRAAAAVRAVRELLDTATRPPRRIGSAPRSNRKKAGRA